MEKENTIKVFKINPLDGVTSGQQRQLGTHAAQGVNTPSRQPHIYLAQHD